MVPPTLGAMSSDIMRDSHMMSMGGNFGPINYSTTDDTPDSDAQ